MKRILLSVSLLGVVGCTSTPQEVKMAPVTKTFHAKAPYKTLGSCLQQQLQSRVGRGAEIRLSSQDWADSMELTYLQQINLAGFIETVYVATLKPQASKGTSIAVQLNQGLFDFAVKQNLENIEQSSAVCDLLIQKSS